MPADNADVPAPAGSVSRLPLKQGGRWRNLVILAGGLAALVGTGAGWLAGGNAYRYEDKPAFLGSADRTVANTTYALMAMETTPGGLSGSGYQILSGVTKDGTIYVQSGAVIVGPVAAPKIVLSGSTITRTIVAGAQGRAACTTTGGTLSYCQAVVAANGTCACK